MKTIGYQAMLANSDPDLIEEIASIESIAIFSPRPLTEGEFWVR